MAIVKYDYIFALQQRGVLAAWQIVEPWQRQLINEVLSKPRRPTYIGGVPYFRGGKSYMMEIVRKWYQHTGRIVYP